MDSTTIDIDGGECADIDFYTNDTTTTNNDDILKAGIIQMQMLNTIETINVEKKQNEEPFNWRSFCSC